MKKVENVLNFLIYTNRLLLPICLILLGIILLLDAIGIPIKMDINAKLLLISCLILIFYLIFAIVRPRDYKVNIIFNFIMLPMATLSFLWFFVGTPFIVLIISDLYINGKNLAQSPRRGYSIKDNIYKCISTTFHLLLMLILILYITALLQFCINNIL